MIYPMVKLSPLSLIVLSLTFFDPQMSYQLTAKSHLFGVLNISCCYQRSLTSPTHSIMIASYFLAIDKFFPKLILVRAKLINPRGMIYAFVT